jgi:nitrogen regulatory protein P-II 1
MWKVEAIIQPHRLQAVRDALADAGVESVTVTDVRGHGRQQGHTEIYRGQEYDAGFLPKIKLEIVVPLAGREAAIAAIIEGARTGRLGDGKIFVLPVKEAVRIRNGQINAAAL